MSNRLDEMIESVSRRAFSSSSGTYNVRALELQRERKLNILNVTVQFLDDTQHSFQIEKKAKGSALLEQVFQHIELIEKDYFGLQFTENGAAPNATNTEITRWLDPSKSVKKQVGGNAQFWLAVRFYPPEPSRLAEEFTRYLLCLQLRKLLLDGRMSAPKNTLLLLASFTVQAELGDYNVSEHPPDYLSEHRLVPKQSAEDERRIRELHKLHSGQAPSDAEANFLEHAKRLDCYGVESHPAKSAEDERRIRELHKLHSGQAPSDAEANFLEHAKRLDCYGVESHPAKSAEDGRRIRELHKLHSGQAPSNDKVNFLEYAKRLDCYGVESHPAQSAEDERRIHELHKLHSGQAPSNDKVNFLEYAKRLDCYGVESHPAQDYNGKDIFIGVTSIGIVVFQNNIRVNTFSWSKIVKISFKRKQFFIQLKREPSESYDTVLGFNMRSGRAAKALWRCSVERHGFFRLRAPRRRPLLGALGALAGITAPTVPRTETQALEDARRSRSSNRTFVRRSSSRTRSRSPGAPPPGAAPGAARGARVTAHDEPPPRPAWTAPVADNEDEGGFLERSLALRVPLSYADDSDTASEVADQTVRVRLSAGADGRFGFNVRGGGGAPVLVSRVAPRSHPQLQEGDQVISINNTDVDDLTHEQVVQIIRNTRGVLTLVLKQNAVYEPEETGPEEPAVCFVPLCSGQLEGDALEQSMLLLGDGLASGAALKQYETLLRRIVEEPCAASRHVNNVNKNRYRDIAPYDSTRVIMKNCSTGDYINASYINMEIPSSELVLTYIATQGPLPSTVGDFWQMVWESESSLVVMLTVLVERGRTKCHQYWPKVGNTPLKATNTLTVQTNSEQNLGHYVRREMTIKESNGATRNITQLQYTAWPDHGVPEDAAAFINFTRLCSQLRNHRAVIPTVIEELEGEAERVLDPPMIVHCSAGVGRTGALILAETAIELLQRRQPFYPLELTRAMRAQRPMCIQNASQYKFVCESILSAYNQGLINESPESGST